MIKRTLMMICLIMMMTMINWRTIFLGKKILQHMNMNFLVNFFLLFINKMCLCNWCYALKIVIVHSFCSQRVEHVHVCRFYSRIITQPLQNSNYCISVFFIFIYILCVCGFLAQFLFDPNSMRQSTLITSNTLVLPQILEIIAIVKSLNLFSFGDDIAFCLYLFLEQYLFSQVTDNYIHIGFCL